MTSSPGVITCKAAVLWKEGEPLKLEEIQVDPPKLNEVRIKMLCASMCHTDVLSCKGYPVPLYPRIPGHEGVGMIECVGDGVEHVKEGDIVLPMYLGECGECLNCKSGKTNMCHTYPLDISGVMPDGTSRMSVRGEKIYHLLSCATWSEFAVIDVNYIVKVDSRVPLPHGSIFSCGFTTGFGSTFREITIEKGSTVAVTGLGAVGLGAVAGAKMHGATRIFGIDIKDSKQEKGKLFGITDFINPKDSEKSVSQLVKDATGGLGVDYFIECTGVPSMLNEAVESSKIGVGTTVIIGVGTQPSGQLNFLPLICGRKVVGSIFGGVRPKSDLPYVLSKCVNKEIDLDQLITHKITLADINKGFEYMKEPNCVKIVINF